MGDSALTLLCKIKQIMHVHTGLCQIWHFHIPILKLKSQFGCKILHIHKCGNMWDLAIYIAHRRQLGKSFKITAITPLLGKCLFLQHLQNVLFLFWAIFMQENDYVQFVYFWLSQILNHMDTIRISRLLISLTKTKWLPSLCGHVPPGCG